MSDDNQTMTLEQAVDFANSRTSSRIATWANQHAATQGLRPLTESAERIVSFYQNQVVPETLEQDLSVLNKWWIQTGVVVFLEENRDF